MAILSKGQTFADADSVTSTKLNNLVDAATFVSGASGSTDDSSLEVNGSGRLQIKDSGVSSAKIAASAVTTAKLPNSTLATDGVTYAKIQQVANMRVLGNTSGALGTVAEVPLLDEDDMASNSATSLASQQSIKAYADTKSPKTVVMTTQATTSGTAFDFTGIPDEAREICVGLVGTSLSGTDDLLVRLGAGTTPETSGYNSTCGDTDGSTTSFSSSGFNFRLASATAAATGMFIIKKFDGVWIMSLSGRRSGGGGAAVVGGGELTFGNVNMVRLTRTGTNTFDAGAVYVSYSY